MKTAVVLLLFLLVSAPADAAPAPLAKKRPSHAPARLPVRCTFWWGGFAYEYLFAPGGYCESWAPGSARRWAGSWRLDRRTRVLTVRERLEIPCEGGPGPWTTYDFRLAPDLRGVEDRSGHYRLEESRDP